MKASARLAAVMALVLSTAAQGQNLSFLNQLPISRLEEADLALFQGALRDILASDDAHAEKSWSNPVTGAKGSVRILGVDGGYGTNCKLLRIRNEVKGVVGSGKVRLCRAQEGEWRLAPLTKKVR